VPTTRLTPNAKQQFFDANGNPLAGGKLYTYAGGTTTLLATYTDSTGTTSNANPIILDSRGEANVWLTPGTSYKFKLTDANDVQIWVVDDISVLSTASFGTVSSVSVVSANGLAGTVANPTTTPAITLSTSVTGLLKGNGTAISAATAGTDYQAPITLTTTGTSGAATFTSNTLNIPQYAGGGGNISAWVNFNGVSTASIRDSFNVSSVTRNGTGDYTVNFTTAMVDTNYAVCASAGYFGGGNSKSGLIGPYNVSSGSAFSTSSIRIGCYNDGLSIAADATFISVVIFS